MLKLLKVSGNSLAPEFIEGDFVILAKIPLFFSHLKQGDTIALIHPDYGRMLKKVDWVTPDQETIFVVGIDKNSIDSRRFGPITRDALLGKVVWHIKKPDRA